MPGGAAAALVEKGSAWINRRELIEENIDLLLQVAEEAERLGEHLVASRAVAQRRLPGRGPAHHGRAARAVRAHAGGRRRAGWDKQSSVAYIEGRIELAWAEGDMAERAGLDRRGPPGRPVRGPRGAGPTSAPSSCTSSGASPTSRPRWPTTSRT